MIKDLAKFRNTQFNLNRKADKEHVDRDLQEYKKQQAIRVQKEIDVKNHMKNFYQM